MKAVHAWSVALVLVALAAGGQAAVVSLDISAGSNHDLYISQAEATEAASYTPREDWGLSKTMVANVFGENSLGNGRTYAFQDQVGDGTALPADGVISFTGWDYQLSLQRDAEPAGGWANPEIPAPTHPRGLMPTPQNVVRANKNRAINANEDPDSTAVVPLPADQVGLYESINFLVAGNDKQTTIYADYEDGQELLWQSPTIDGETGFPAGLGTSSSNPDIVAAFSCDRAWSQSGDRSAIRSENGTVWTFAQPLDLDPTRTLNGFTLAVKGDDKWNGRTAFVLAASADLVPEPTSLALLSLGAATLIRRRR